MRTAPARTILALAGLASLTLLSACAPGTDPEAGGDCEVRTLLVGSMTGPTSDHSLGEKAGAESAVRTINDAGGINGCTLVLDVKDDGGDVTQTLPITQAALQEHDYAHVNITAYGGPSVLPYLISEGQFAITTLGVADVLDPAQAKFQFDNINLLTDTDSAVAARAVDDGATSIGIIVDNTAVGASLVDAVSATIEDAGAEVAAVESVDVAAVDYAPVVQRLKASGADTVFVDLYGASLGYAIRDIKASGWDAPIYTGQIAYVTDLGPLLPEEDYAGVIQGGAAGVSAPSNDAVQALIDDVKANGDDKLASHLGGVIWASDSLVIFAWAANSVGSTDPAELSTFLEENGDVEVPGLGMALTTGYSSSNHDWKGKDGIALIEAAPRDEDGRHPNRVALLTAGD